MILRYKTTNKDNNGFCEYVLDYLSKSAFYNVESIFYNAESIIICQYEDNACEQRFMVTIRENGKTRCYTDISYEFNIKKLYRKYFLSKCNEE